VDIRKLSTAIIKYCSVIKALLQSLLAKIKQVKFLRKRKWQITTILLLIFTVYIAIPLPSKLFPDDYSQMIVDSNGEILRVFLNRKQQWCFPDDNNVKIPDKLKTAVINYEDEYFRWHPGVNPVSVIRAAIQNVKSKRVVSGASTLTMQLARMIEGNERTFTNKVKEMFLAIKLEVYYSKDNILRLYLNHAPYGGNIRGYRAASLRYFRKNPEELSWAQAASLAVLPNAPGNVSPAVNKDILRKKRNQLLKKLLINGEIDESTYKLAIDEPLPRRVYPFRITAHHLTRKIHTKYARENIVHTTLDLKIQRHLEFLCRHHTASLRRQGISNSAVLLLDTETSAIKAYVGSADFFDTNSQGQVDGVIAPRSSGSVLKPFLYALAMDEGMILPNTLIKDVPSYYEAFSPKNADKKYNGIVHAQDALVRSLNIPAVRLLNMYGVYSFYAFLKDAGVSTLFRTADDYGLPLILGGAEVTVTDMAMLYQGLGNGGVFTKPYFLKKDSTNINQSTNRLISKGACYLTLNMLKELKRPGAEYYWQQYSSQKPVAWKTGTSYGHKDAWAVGVTPKWTIAVWAGNFDGEGNPNISGASSAGTLLFDIINYLDADPDRLWFPYDEYDFKRVKVCKETGFIAGEYCDNTEEVWAPSDMNSMRLCPYHKNIYLDATGKHQVCSYCWDDNHISKHYLIYPADVNYELKKRGHIPEVIPTHNRDCNIVATGNPMHIIYPRDSAKVWIPRDFNGDFQRLVVKVAHNNPEKRLFWYLDDVYLGVTTDKSRYAVSVNKGWHDIIVKDEDGYTEQVRFFVNVKR
jgi:penicillin-binding protein 1C